MRFRDVMAFYDYKMNKILQDLHVGRLTLLEWKKKDTIPFEKQCVLEVKSNGVLKANRDGG